MSITGVENIDVAGIEISPVLREGGEFDLDGSRDAVESRHVLLLFHRVETRGSPTAVDVSQTVSGDDEDIGG